MDEELKRNIGYDVLALVDVAIARDGQLVAGKKVDKNNLPDPVTAKEAWRYFGLGSNFSSTQDQKEISLDAFASSGKGIKHREFMLLGLSLKFTMAQMSPEAYELMLGLSEQIKDSTEQQLAASSTGCIEGWITITIKRSQDQTDRIKPLVAHGRLRLANPPQATSDFAKPEFEFIVDIENPLNTVTPLNIQASGIVA